MSAIEQLLETQKIELEKAIAHLDYSYHKARKLSFDVSSLYDEALETWGSFAVRFFSCV